MEKHCAKFCISSSGRVIIILDAGESADGYWDRIVQIARDISFRISAEIRREYYALGNSRPYPESFLEFPSKMKEENQYGGSFISPVLEGIDGAADKIVVIGNGLIYDIEDWADEGFARSFLFINAGEAPLCPHNIGKSVSDTDYASYISEIRKKIEKVVIHGKFFMPFFWNNRAYRLDFRSGKALLTAEHSGDLNVDIGYLGENAEALICYEDGGEIPVQPFSASPQEENWLPLTPAEADLFRRASSSAEFLCPYCEEMHEQWETRCPNMGILGKALFESLEGREGMVLFRESGGEVLYLSQGAGACYAGENRVAAGSGGRARFYEFDPKRGEWRETGVVEQYREITPGRRLLWL